MTRRKILTSGAAVLGLVAALPGLGFPSLALAEPGAIYDDDRILGKADAPVTIIEYASLTCPHCASFHDATLPEIKSNWIDEGRARLVYRHFPLDGLALRAAALANCFEGDRYFKFLDALFDTQKRWARSQDALAELGRIAKLAGMDQATFDRCINDQAEMDRILARVQDAQKEYDVRSTPTLIVNGKKLVGGMSYPEFEKALEAAAPKS